MDVHVSLEGRGDRSTRIYRALLDAILDGRLRPSERLPPTREFAERLAVSRNTVSSAYERLTAEGFLVSRVGAGTFVCAEPLGQPNTAPSHTGPSHTGPLPAVPTRTAPAGPGVAARALWRAIAEAEPERSVAQPRYDLRVGVPEAGLFPFETWRRLVTSELRRSTMDAGSAGDPAYYGDPAGHAGLRASIARYAGVARSVRAGAADVIVTQGAQQALDLVGRVLIDPGGCVAVEEPGYPEARLLFRSQGADVTGIPVDAEGIDVAAIPDRARLVYVTPSHQFPLGMPMSLARRAALLAWAERHDAVIIEDDYDSEFRFSDRPLAPLQSIDRGGRVVYVGTFSKTLLPMLRLGYLIAPAALQPALRAAKRLTDWHGSLPLQAALARFIDEGLLARHVRRATRTYRQRHALIVAALHRDLAGWLDLVPSAAGLHLCVRLRPDAAADVDRVAAVVAAQGVAVPTLGHYYAEGPPVRDGLVLGFGAIATADIDPALSLITEAFGTG